MSLFNRARIALAYAGFAAAFVLVFAVMFLLLTVAVIGAPAGLMLGFFGTAILLFKADFVITELAPQLMLTGGLAAAFASLFCGLLAIKAGFMISRAFISVRRFCDKLREI